MTDNTTAGVTDLYALFETDKKFETKGIWYTFSEDEVDKEGVVIKKGTKFLLARAGGANTAFAKSLEVKTRPYRRQIDNDNMDPDLAMKLMVEAFVGTVLLDWVGAMSKKGKHLKYSKENAIKLMTDLPDLFTELRTEAQRLSNFQAEQIEDDSGN